MEFIEYFEENCKSFPDIPALRSVTNKKGITYGELNQYSASVYAYLKKKGIGREQMVFVYLPRDTGIVVAMLGVIKAGAAFVLCEDTYPKDRVEFIKKDCGCVLTIDEKIFEEMLAELPLYGHEKTSPHDACFAVYTSGSTGTPKGVLHEYGKLIPIVESLCLVSPDLPLGAINALSAPFTFVAAVILALRTTYDGLCLYILSYDIAKNVTKLSEFIKNEDVKEAFLSLSILKLCKDDLYEGLVHVFAGGEAYNNICLPKGVCFTGTYCSSESAFLITSFRIDKSYEKIPAGKNTIGIDILILDDDGHRLTDGQIGEICFKNEFTRGYINLPEKTAESFVNGVYHTGDLGYIGEDGNLFICGRKDDMIKIDGNRIEPTEIEAVIKNELGLSNVVAKGFQDKKRSFICMYLLERELQEKNLMNKDGSLAVSNNELSERLSKKLPYYMIPTYYSVLPSFPLNANGKLARKELKMPDLECFQREYVSPSNEMEEKFCRVMAEVLDKRVGATDDFYEIGGSSIAAMKVIAQLSLDQLNVNMLLKGRTPREIVKLYEKESSDNQIDLKTRNEILLLTDQPISKGQEYACSLHQEMPNCTQWNLPILLKFDNDTDCLHLKKSVDTVLAARPIFSCVFAMGANGGIVYKYNANKKFDTKILNVTETEFEILKETLVQPFELFGKPLYRIRLLKTENGGYLFCDFHHVISDGTAIKMFLEDVSKVYEGMPLENDYYFVALDERRKKINSPLCLEAKKYYDKVYGQYEWSICLKPDNDTRKNKYGATSIAIPLASDIYKKIYRQYGIGKNAFFITVACIAIAIANKENNIMISWIYSGRDTLAEQHAMGGMIRVFYVGIHFDNEETINDIYCDVVKQVRNNIYYSCYNYLGPQNVRGDEEASLNFLQDLRSLAFGGKLSWTRIDLTKSKKVADNLLDLEILDGDNGCSLLIEYNACAYNEETIDSFKKLFVKTAIILAEYINYPDTCLAKVMKKIEQDN